jgi:protein-tyrosine-phosphatase
VPKRLAWGAAHRLHWKFDDPAAFEGDEAQKLAKFSQVRDEIDAAVKAFVAEARARLSAEAQQNQ